IQNHVLYFADQLPKAAHKFEEIDSADFDFLDFYKGLKKRSAKNFVVLGKAPKKIFKSFKKKVTTIKAGGGLVENANGEFLFIFRNKKWDLPKGKIEKGEKLKVTAVREVEEECGVKIESRGKCLCKTYHVYELNGKIILKQTKWFKMHVKGSPKLIPQKEEGITSATWVAPSAVKLKIKNTYPLILDVLEAEKLIGK
ncbi:MAG: NUDIX domain-containing protein, partial [Pedobacter sp.]|nr:NUDIX domain-containing protein [Pedobacter sp.]